MKKHFGLTLLLLPLLVGCGGTSNSTLRQPVEKILDRQLQIRLF